MNNKLFIADKIKVGFNERSDTYTGMLGYVIGHDGKKWRKEPSWESWREKFMEPEAYEKTKKEAWDNQIKNLEYYRTQYKYSDEQMASMYKNIGADNYETYNPRLYKWSGNEKIKPVEFDNVPTEGFVLNKKVGGYRSSWNARATYSRVYDPRGFEFEITIPNLLYILQECNAYKGKGLEGSFVYAWDGKDLVLLPTSSSEYQESQIFTKLQSCKIGVKDLLEGCTYKDKQLNDYIYLGKFNWFDYSSNYSMIEKKHVFYLSKSNTFFGYTSLSSFSQRVTDTPVTNYAELLDKFNDSNNSGVLKDISFDEFIPPSTVSSYGGTEFPGSALIEISPNTFEVYEISGNRGDSEGGYRYSSKYSVKSYNLKTTKVVSLDGLGDYKIKTKAPKVISNVSKIDFDKYKFKALTINKNNKKIAVEF